MTKKLFILVCDHGDGSYGLKLTMDQAEIDRMQNAYDNDELDYDAPGCDGDGFHYTTLYVPDECTIETLRGAK